MPPASPTSPQPSSILFYRTDPLCAAAAPAAPVAGLDDIAAAGAADLAQAFRGDLAPVARIIRESRTAAECEARLLEFTVNWKPGRAAVVLEQALTAYAANGVALSRYPGIAEGGGARPFRRR